MTHRKTSKPSAHGRSDDAHAFLPDPGDGPATSDDDLAEALAESFLSSATSGEEDGEDMHEQEVPEEEGGPFIVSSLPKELEAMERSRAIAKPPARGR